MNDRVPMTVNGKLQMQKKLKQLKEIERPKIIKEIEVARAHGDLSENAEYQYAKDQQGMIESYIRNFEGKISSSEVIDPSKLSGERIVFGATVTVYEFDTEKKSTYQIVGADESDFENGLLSIESAMARALMGKSEGDEATVRTPKGTRDLEVVSVEFK